MQLSFLIVYVGVLALIALIYRRHSSTDDFLLSNRSAGAVALAASIFTLIGGGELIALVSLTYNYGFSGISLFVGYAIGFVVLALLAKRIRKNSDKNLLHSIPDYFYQHYGKLAGLMTFLLSFFAFFALLVIQFSAGAFIIAEFTTWTYELSILVCGIIVGSYLFLGGFKTVLATDVLQGVVMLILLPVLLIVIMQGDVETTFSSVQVDSLGIGVTLSLVLAGIFTAVGSADVWQRIYAAKNLKSVKRGIYIASLLFLLFGFGLVVFGLYVKGVMPEVNPDSAFILGISNLLPKVWADVVLLLVFSAILSTADTEVFLLSSMISREYQRWKGGYKSNFLASQATSTLHARISIIAVTVLGLLVSLYLISLMALYEYLLGLIMIISPILITSFFIKLRSSVVAGSLIANTILFIVLVVGGYLTAANLVYIVLPGLVITLIGWGVDRIFVK